MHQLLDLVCVNGIEPRVAVAHIDSGDTTGEIDELPAGFIVEVLHVAPHCEEGLLVVGFVEGEHVLVVQLQHLLPGDACVWLRLEGRELGEQGAAGGEGLHGGLSSALNILAGAIMAKDLNICHLPCCQNCDACLVLVGMTNVKMSLGKSLSIEEFKSIKVHYKIFLYIILFSLRQSC